LRVEGDPISLTLSLRAVALLLTLWSAAPAVAQTVIPQQADSGVELVVAAWTDEAERVRQLLDAGAPVNARNTTGATALMVASGRGHLAIAKLLLERGADPNLQDALGRTALFVPAMLGISKVVELLLAAGADPNLASSGNDVLPNTPLHLAAANSRRRVAGLLIEAGAYVCVRDASGATPLELAQRHDASRATLKMLRLHGGDCASHDTDHRARAGSKAND